MSPRKPLEADCTGEDDCKVPGHIVWRGGGHWAVRRGHIALTTGQRQTLNERRAAPAGLTCYVPADPGDVLVCEACGTRTGYASPVAAGIAWTLHVLQEHWEQAGYTREQRDDSLRQLAEVLK